MLRNETRTSTSLDNSVCSQWQFFLQTPRKTPQKTPERTPVFVRLCPSLPAIAQFARVCPICPQCPICPDSPDLPELPDLPDLPCFLRKPAFPRKPKGGREADTPQTLIPPDSAPFRTSCRTFLMILLTFWGGATILTNWQHGGSVSKCLPWFDCVV